MKIKLIDAYSSYREVRKEFECTKDNIREVLKKINAEYDICIDEALDDLVEDLLNSAGYAECEDYGGTSWILELASS